MALKIKDYKTKLAQAIKELNDTRQRDALLVVTDGIELVKLRVIDKGTNANGAKFSPYSRRILPWHWFGSSYGKNGIKPLNFNVGTRIQELKDQKPLGASYFDWRQITGRKSPFKNFSFDNQMWASIRAKITGSNKQRVTVEISSAIGIFNDKIIPHHSNREGINILQTSEKEREMVYLAFKNRRLDILRKNGLLK